MKIYIATKFENQQNFHELAEKLRARGHTITHDWTTESCEGMDGAERFHYTQQCAIKDVQGVAAADAVVVITHPKLSGALTELGVAIGLNKRIVIVNPWNPEAPYNIFYHLPYVEHVKTLDGAAEALGYGDLGSMLAHRAEVEAKTPCTCQSSTGL